ncbi:type I toxin-antitoxin system Fst family toxin, partial [Enterococcus faecalis]|uniref:type I toxin-antitoxin system Fst family toxin n=1 Tax=Enterococcus faecalis TaxID=1351 RepID=UPI000CF29991
NFATEPLFQKASKNSTWNGGVCAHTRCLPFSYSDIVLYSKMATAPKGGVVMLKEIITLVVAPLFVALVTTLVDHWLDNRDDN